jgi:hypothetical protein
VSLPVTSCHIQNYEPADMPKTHAIMSRVKKRYSQFAVASRPEGIHSVPHVSAGRKASPSPVSLTPNFSWVNDLRTETVLTVSPMFDLRLRAASWSAPVPWRFRPFWSAGVLARSTLRRIQQLVGVPHLCGVIGTWNFSGYWSLVLGIFRSLPCTKRDFSGLGLALATTFSSQNRKLFRDPSHFAPPTRT